MKGDKSPILFEMSVGGGKSICIASILLSIQKAGKSALCLVDDSELVRNNSHEFINFGGQCSVFCATLKSKEYKENIIFASPQSLWASIKRGHPVSEKLFNLILIDEAHMINYQNDKTTYMKILNHYRLNYNECRVVGFTGTPFRGNGIKICGDGADYLFNRSCAHVDIWSLIQKNYLVPMKFGVVDKSIDFSKVKTNRMGLFDSKDVANIVNSNRRLTYEILQEVQEIMKERNGAFLFCATINHCYEAFASLPDGEAKIIIGSTPGDERNEILQGARVGKYKYLISVNCLLKGINVPYFDTIVWLTGTESLIKFEQGIGRGLRLHDSKNECLILDYAKNIERHAEMFENRVLIDAISQKEKEINLVFECPSCNTMNGEFSRRCVGFNDGVRCDFYFQHKDCEKCNTKNDIAARQCRNCKEELLDPNRKLSKSASSMDNEEVAVLSAKYWIKEKHPSYNFIACYYVHPKKELKPVWIYESFIPSSDKALNFFYGSFLKKHLSPLHSALWYKNNNKLYVITALLKQIINPNKMTIYESEGKYKIRKKIF